MRDEVDAERDADRDPALARLFRASSPAPSRQRIREVVAEALALDAEALPELLSAGDALGGYEVESLLGVGGQAVVYRARETELGRLMALKVPHEPVEEALLEEARAAASIEHPRIVRVERLSREPRLHLVMELLPRSLADVLSAEPGGLPVERVRRLAADIAEALVHAHGKGLVHRDLKPENVLIDDGGRAKLADFGLAAAQQAQATGAGTPLYMAPEQRRPGAPVTAAADAYAFGKLLYAMLSGRLPETVLPLGRARAGLDPAWEELVFGLLDEVPEERPSLAAVQDALAALAPDDAAPAAVVVGPTPGRRAWVRVAGGLAVACLLALFGLAYASVFSGARVEGGLPWALGGFLVCAAAWLWLDLSAGD